jgi:ATP-dependent DNA ligase
MRPQKRQGGEALSRPGDDLTDRFPLIVAALADIDGEDMRRDPLAVRKATLASLLARASSACGSMSTWTRRRPARIRACLQARARRHRVEAA